MPEFFLSWLWDARRDSVHAARVFMQHPVFALTAVLSLAIGIGANTTIFTVANALMFRPPAGVAEPERLVDIGVSRAQTGGFNPASYPNYRDIARRTTTLDGVYGLTLFGEPLTLGPAGRTGAAEQAFASYVTTNYFTVLGARPSVGRLFDPSDSAQPGGSPVVVLSHAFWTRRFRGDPAIVGQPVALNGETLMVVGVAAEGFQGTGIRIADMWIPANMTGFGTGNTSAALTNRAAGWLMLGGRLKPGVTIAQTAAELTSISQTLEREYPDDNRGLGLRVAALSPVPGNRETLGLFLGLLMATVLIVLAIACANLVGVLLARSVARRREIAVRLAIGADRSRVIRLLLTETVLLFVLGGAGGLLAARGMTSLLLSLLPALPFPIDLSLPLDRRVIAVTTGLSLLAALLSGLVPALQGSKADVVSALKDDSQGSGSGRARLRHAFVIAQVAFSILLVVVASLFVRALQRAGAMDPGFDPGGVEVASIDLSVARYNQQTGRLFARELLERVRALPTVQDGTLAAGLPGGFEDISLGGVAVPELNRPPGQDLMAVTWNTVEPGYFTTIRMAMRAGRDFNADDREGAPDVAIIGEHAARRFWPGQEPVGKYILQREWGLGPGGTPKPSRRLVVVGVVRDPKYGSLIDSTTGLQIYVPLQQQYTARLLIIARSSHGQRVAHAIRTLVASMNPRLPVRGTQTAEEYTRFALLPQRIAVSVSGSLGLVGLLLAAIGIYGVTAYMVACRTREIGIRVAMGARRSAIVRMVVGQGMVLALIGSVIGLTLAAGVSQFLKGFLFGVPPLDPPAFIGAAALFAVIALIACGAPARRAATIEPLIAFRQE